MNFWTLEKLTVGLSVFHIFMMATFKPSPPERKVQFSKEQLVELDPINKRKKTQERQQIRWKQNSRKIAHSCLINKDRNQCSILAKIDLSDKEKIDLYYPLCMKKKKYSQECQYKLVETLFKNGQFTKAKALAQYTCKTFKSSCSLFLQER